MLTPTEKKTLRLLKALVEKEDAAETSHNVFRTGYVYHCAYCHGAAHRSIDPRPPHKKTCPIAKAREFLREVEA